MELSGLDKRLLNDFQRDFPLEPEPYAVLAERLGVSEAQVLEALQALQEAGAVARVGPVFRPNGVGVSTLAAMAVAPHRLAEIAALVSAHPAVNHNYEREHRFNLWFVVTAPDANALQQALEEIEQSTGCPLLDLPLQEDYHIDLGFELQWT